MRWYLLILCWTILAPLWAQDPPLSTLTETYLTDGRHLTGITAVNRSPSGDRIAVVATEGAGVYRIALFDATFLAAWHIDPSAPVPAAPVTAGPPPTQPAVAQPQPAALMAQPAVSTTDDAIAKLQRQVDGLRDQIAQRKKNLAAWKLQTSQSPGNPPPTYHRAQVETAPSPMNGPSDVTRQQMIVEYQAETDRLSRQLVDLSDKLRALKKAAAGNPVEASPSPRAVPSSPPVRRLGLPSE